jgi:hypothetical protein
VTSQAILSTEPSQVQDPDMVPFWDLEDGSQPYYLDSLLVGNDIDLGDLNLSFLGATAEYPVQALSRGELQSPQHRPTLRQPDTDSSYWSRTEADDTILQQSWHTYCVLFPRLLAM